MAASGDAANQAGDSGPSTSSATEAAPPTTQNVPQGEAHFSDTEIRIAIDAVIEQSRRLRFSSIDRNKIIFRSLDVIPENEVQKRLQDVLTELYIAAKTSDQIRYAMAKTDGIALLA